MPGDLENRLIKLENSIGIIDRMDQKIDKIAEITTKLATIEERHQYQSTAIDRAFVAIEKNATQIDALREAFSIHDKYTATAVADLKEQTFKKIKYHIEELHVKHESMHQRVDTLGSEVISNVSWAKGAWFAASILWVIIQLGMIWGLKNAGDTISETKAAVIELRIENNTAIQHNSVIDRQLKSHEELFNRLIDKSNNPSDEKR
jgi:hypothetical protein